MDNDVCCGHLFERGAEGRDQLGWQIGDKANRVRQYRLVITRQREFAHRRVEGGKQQILGKDIGAGQAVEQGRFPGVCIADQRDHRPGRALAPFAMQGPGLAQMGQILAQFGHAIPDHPAIGLDLGFARSAKEAEAAALPFQVGPAADQTTSLIVEMGELDLKAPFRRGGPGAEYLQNQAGSVNYLDVQLLFQIPLLDGAETAIHNQDRGGIVRHHLADLVDLARPEQRRRLGFANREIDGVGGNQTNRPSETGRFGQTMLKRRLAQRDHVRMRDQRPTTFAVETFLLKWDQCAPSSALL